MSRSSLLVSVYAVLSAVVAGSWNDAESFQLNDGSKLAESGLDVRAHGDRGRLERSRRRSIRLLSPFILMAVMAVGFAILLCYSSMQLRGKSWNVGVVVRGLSAAGGDPCSVS